MLTILFFQLFCWKNDGCQELNIIFTSYAHFAILQNKLIQIKTISDKNLKHLLIFRLSFSKYKWEIFLLKYSSKDNFFKWETPLFIIKEMMVVHGPNTFVLLIKKIYIVSTQKLRPFKWYNQCSPRQYNLISFVLNLSDIKKFVKWQDPRNSFFSSSFNNKKKKREVKWVTVICCIQLKSLFNTMYFNLVPSIL